MPDRFASRKGRVLYVAADRLAAAQWRCHLAREALAEGRRVVHGREVLPFRTFVANLWAARRPPGAPIPLSPRQSRALWRQVIAASPEGSRLLGTVGTARWADDAWRLAAAYRVDLDAVSAGRRGTDFAVFARWARAYRARLRDGGWIDDALLDDALLDRALLDAVPPDQALLDDVPPDQAVLDDALLDDALLGERRGRPGPAPLVLADVVPTPSERAVVARLERAGTPVRVLAPPAVHCRAATLRCADPAEELAAAAEWAARALVEKPGECFAIVVPELGARATEVRRCVRDALESIAGADAAGRLFVATERWSADERPLLGAVLDALELPTPAAGFATLSRWLRSPFFHDERSRASAAALERRLRDDSLAQVPFLDAYRRLGLRDRMRAALPDAASRLDTALELLAAAGGTTARRSPAGWAALWPRVLDALGGPSWAASRQRLPTEHALYEEALVELARLTPILETMTAAEALGELETGMIRARPTALPLAGVHVLAGLEDVGPGYAGVWVTGATDERLPRPVALCPFLPRDVQIDAGMPWSSPRDALERSRALLERVSARVPDAIYSWPEHVRDEPAEPSPLIRGYPALEGARIRASASSRSASARRREILPDPAPPLTEEALRGGTAALNAHASCPLRAFCEHRLGARPLTPLARGTSPAARGTIVHRALERLFRRIDSHSALARATPGLEDAMRRDADRAAAEIIGRGHALLDALAEIEAGRVVAVLSAFVARERERAPFRVESLELDETLSIGGKTLRVRIDRIDALESGGIAVIDYKTGSAPRVPDWQSPRLRDVQLPLYATAMPAERLSALAVAVLRTDRATYSGLWNPADAFPGRGNAGADLRPADLVDAWRQRIAALVGEYAAGDVRLFFDGWESAAGPYAPLSRVYELLASERGPRSGSSAGEGR